MSPTGTPVVRLQSASVAYDGRTALRDVDVRVDAGEVVAVLGANGSGKSTLVKAVVGLLPLAAGTLELFGTPRERFTDWTRLGYVPQRAGAATGVPATVREVVSTGRLALTGFRRQRPADREAVTRALEVVGLAARAGDSVSTLSGGQQQRVLIARALTCSPDLLVLDEPTAGVDLASQSALAETLTGLVAAGTTVVLVAHELGPMHALISRALTMADGRVLHDGPPPEPDHLHLHDPEHVHPVHEVPQSKLAGLGPAVNPLSFQFMQLALVSALLVGLAAPAVGVFLVQRRLALMGDGLGHVALTGVALGFLLGTAPVLTAVAVATAGAVVIELVRQQGRTSGDVALALMFYGGIAGGVLLISLSDSGTNANLLSYLFGSLTAVAPLDAVVIAVLAGGLLLTLAVVGRQLFAVCHDEEHAKVMGLHVRGLNLLLAVMAALTVTVGMRVVGLLLVSALMVVPVATAQQLVRGFRATVVVSLAVGVLAAVGGVFGSYYADTPPGALIVVLALGGFALATLVGAVVRRTRRDAGAPARDDDRARRPEEATTA